MADREREPVLVADAGSSSVHLTVFANDGSAIASYDDTSAPGDNTAGQLRDLLRYAPAPTASGTGSCTAAPSYGTTPWSTTRSGTPSSACPTWRPRMSRPLCAYSTRPASCCPTCRTSPASTPSSTPVCPRRREFAVPETWRGEFGVRRYGFHGLSYAWALARTAELLGRRPESLRIVIAHLGGGCSACAVRDGTSVDTTMGFTPLDGLVMSRRSGAVDPGP